MRLGCNWRPFESSTDLDETVERTLRFRRGRAGKVGASVVAPRVTAPLVSSSPQRFRTLD